MTAEPVTRYASERPMTYCDSRETALYDSLLYRMQERFKDYSVTDDTRRNIVNAIVCNAQDIHSDLTEFLSARNEAIAFEAKQKLNYPGVVTL